MFVHFRVNIQVLALLFVTVIAPHRCLAQDCDTLYQSAMHSYRNVDWDRAYMNFDRAKTCFKQQQKWELYTSCGRGMSSILSRQGEHDKIPPILLSSIDTLKKYADTTTYHKLVGKIYRSLGGTYSNLKNSDEAIYYLNQSLNFTNDDTKKIITYINLGVAYENKLNYENAILYHSKALNLLSDTFDIENKTILKIRTLNNLGQAHRRYKRYEDALQNFETGLELLRDFKPQNDMAKDEKTSLRARYYSNIGVLYTYWKKYDKALEYLGRIRKMDLPLSKNTLHHYDLNVGYVYLEKNNYEKAKQSFTKAIKVEDQLHTSDKHIDKAIAYSSLGETHYQQKSWKPALDNLQQALIQAIPIFNDTAWSANPDIKGVHHVRTILITLELKANALYQYYQTTQNKADLDAALNSYQTALQLVDKIRIEQQHDESVFSLLRTARPIYEGAIEAAYTANKLELVYQWMEKSKAVVLLTALRDAGAKLTAGIPDDLLDEERDLKADIAYNKQKLNKAQRTKNQDKVKEINTILFEKREQLQKLLYQLETNYPEYYTIKYNTDVASIDELKHKLKAEKSVAIEFFMGEKILYTCIIDGEKIALHQLEKEADFEVALTDFLATTSNPSSKISDFEAYTHSASLLYQKLLKPILPSTQNILIILDGKLTYLAFDALIQHPVKGEYNEPRYDTLSYLVNQFNINYAYSASVLLEKKPQKSAQRLKPFAGFAPGFSSGKIAQIRGENLDSLIHNQREVEAIKQIMGGSAYLNEAATTRHFFDHADEYQILHFATHVVAGDTTQNTGHRIHLNDSILLADHIYNSSLNTDLVVLSACETGQGEFIEGEGVMSLARAFRYTGCPSLTASLWSVDDKSTADIMIDFYKNLHAQQAQDQALTNSKRNYLQQLNTYEKAHPFYWAGFVHVGDTSAIALANNSLEWLWWGLGFVVLFGLWRWLR